MQIDFINTNASQLSPEVELSTSGVLQGRAVKPIAQSVLNKPAPLLKTWEIVICAISVIGLLVLIGLYLGRKAKQNHLPQIEFYVNPEQEVVAGFVQDLIQPSSAGPDAELKSKKAQMLQDNPSWVAAVNDWREITLIDQVWLLQVFELRRVGLVISPLEKLSNPLPAQRDLLPSVGDLKAILELKNEIQQFLDGVRELFLSHKDYIKSQFPSSALELLPNLSLLNSNSFAFSVCPDLSKNPQLETLVLIRSKLPKAPDLHNNPQLKEIDLSNCELEECPDFSNKPNLTSLNLSNNKLSKAPDVSKNTMLESLDLSTNKLTKAPDLSKNPNLTNLLLNINLLTIPPDLSFNPKTHTLNLSENKLVPNLTWKGFKHLNTLFLYDCALTEFPIEEFSSLNSFFAQKNMFNQTTKNAIADWKRMNPKAIAWYD